MPSSGTLVALALAVTAGAAFAAEPVNPAINAGKHPYGENLAAVLFEYFH
jgi:hypothetical protein